jgi:hypothetical protein
MSVVVAAPAAPRKRTTVSVERAASALVAVTLALAAAQAASKTR